MATEGGALPGAAGVVAPLVGGDVTVGAAVTSPSWYIVMHPRLGSYPLLSTGAMRLPVAASTAATTSVGRNGDGASAC